MPVPEYDIKYFAAATDMELWMASNHAATPGIWLKIAKKDSRYTSPSYAEALDIALCYGWIDGQVKKLDADFYLQKFTPRRSRSIWSKINTGHIARLTSEGRMQPTGLAQVAAAKADGRWDAAYASPKIMEAPADFLKTLDAHPAAKDKFFALTKTQRYHYLWPIITAKRPETRQARIAKVMALLAKDDVLY